MCYDASYNGNKVQVCTVGDCGPGTQYRTPDGETMLITNQPPASYGDAVTVNLRTGLMVEVSPSVKLGTDRRGRLYASRSLNPTAPPAGFADDRCPTASDLERQEATRDAAEETVDLNDAFEERHPSDYIDPPDSK